MSHPRSGRTPALAALLALLPVACASGPKLFPVAGKVLVGDQPAEGADVVFHLANGPADAPKPSGTVAADGTFTLHTHPHGTGAPPGEYVVLVSWYPPDARAMENPKNKLPEVYSDPTRSPLRATVKDGPTELEPIRLPAPKK